MCVRRIRSNITISDSSFELPVQPNPFGNTEKVLRDWCIHKSTQIFTDWRHLQNPANSGGAASPLPDSPPHGQRGRCPSWICGGGLRLEGGGEFALEAGGRVLRHAVGAVLSPLGECQLTERILADAVEVPAPETAVIMISPEYGYGYTYGVEGGVEEGVGSHAHAHTRTGYGYGSGFFFPFFFFFIGGCGGKGFFFLCA